MDLRILKCVEGLHYSFELLDYYYANLYRDCTEIRDDRSKYLRALASSWGFIEALHRLREIALALPGISSKEPGMRSFLASTVIVETCRHYVQYLRGELSKEKPDPFPVWGSLAWVDENDPMCSHTMVIGTQTPGTSYSGLVFDAFNQKWVSRVCLSINSHSFSFDPVYESCIRFKNFIIPWIESYSRGAIKIADELPIMTTTLNVKIHIR